MIINSEDPIYWFSTFFAAGFFSINMVNTFFECTGSYNAESIDLGKAVKQT